MKKKIGVYNTLIIIQTRNKKGDILYKVKDISTTKKQEQ